MGIHFTTLGIGLCKNYYNPFFKKKIKKNKNIIKMILKKKLKKKIKI